MLIFVEANSEKMFQIISTLRIIPYIVILRIAKNIKSFNFLIHLRETNFARTDFVASVFSFIILESDYCALKNHIMVVVCILRDIAQRYLAQKYLRLYLQSPGGSFSSSYCNLRFINFRKNKES